jgi:hypothetical protein
VALAALLVALVALVLATLSLVWPWLARVRLDGDVRRNRIRATRELNEMRTPDGVPWRDHPSHRDSL